MLHTAPGTFTTREPEARWLTQIWGQDGLYTEFQQSKELLESDRLFEKKKTMKGHAHTPSHYVYMKDHRR